MNEEKLKIAVFIDFDNIQIGVRSTLSRDFDLGLVLEALKERGEVVTKVAYGNWKRAGDLTRTLTQNAVLMVQRDLTPRGDKNGADINLALDALETAIHHPHINAFVIVGGDSDFIALVEKLKVYNKAVFVVGGRSFTSSVLQRNCREFIAYENLIESQGSDRRREEGMRRRDVYPLSRALPLVDRALKVLSDREVQAQLGLLKSTLIQLDSTFNERDYGASSFRQFVQKLADIQVVSLRQQGNSFVVEPVEREALTIEASEPVADVAETGLEGESAEVIEMPVSPASVASDLFVTQPSHSQEEAVELLQKVLLPLRGTNPRPLYLRNVKQLLRTEQPTFDEQNYGFASLVDLLRAGQNLNLLRLQRDRRGALRVFIPGPPPAVTSMPVGEEVVAGVEQQAAAAADEAEFSAESAERDALLEVVLAENAVADEEQASSENLVPVLPASDDPEDSQIAILGYYDGVPGGEVTEEPKLSLAAAVAEEAAPPRKKRAPRKTAEKAAGAKPATTRRRKPAASKISTKPSRSKS